MGKKNPPGLKIDNKAWNKLLEEIPEMGKTRLVVGVLAERYGADIVEGSDGLTMAELMLIQEYGSAAAHIPERSSLRATFEDRATQKEAGAIIKAALTKVPTTGSARIKLLNSIFSKVGWHLVNAVKDRIRAGIAPALAPSTIAARKRAGRPGTTPLLDQRHLINAISWSTAANEDSE